MNIDFAFREGMNLAYLLRSPETAEQLIRGGFTAFNRQDALGEHCLFGAASYLDSQTAETIQTLIKGGWAKSECAE